MAADWGRCRLCLATPADRGLEDCTRLVADALSGGDVAALILTVANPAGDQSLQALAQSIVPLAAARGVATMIHNDTRIAGRVRADGVHIDTGLEEVEAALASGRGKRMVGAGGIRSRHDAIVLGEAEPDYLFFGRIDGDRDRDVFAPALELAAWWAEVALVPAIVMGGSDIRSVEAVAEAGIDFVMLSRAIFDHPGGAAGAVAEANTLLARLAEAVA